MAGGGFAVDSANNGFAGKITLSVIISCIVAASSGLLFGYDIGISGYYLFFPDLASLISAFRESAIAIGS